MRSKYPMIQTILPPNPAPEQMPSPALLQQGSEHTSDTRFEIEISLDGRGQNTSSKYILLTWVIHVERFSTRLNSPKESKDSKSVCQLFKTIIGIPKDNRTPLIGRVF